MSDFLARVTAEFDESSLSTLEGKLSKLKARISNFELDTKGLPSQIDAELEKHKFTIHLNGIKMDNISTQGTKIGQNLSQNIARAIQSGGIDAQIKKIQSSWTSAFNSTSLSKNVDLNGKLLGIKGEVDSLTSSYQALLQAQQSEDVTAMVSQYTALTDQMTQLRNNIAGVTAEEKAFESSNRAVSTSLKELSARNTLSNQITAWMNQNAQAADMFGARLQDLKARLDSGAVSSSQAAAEFRQIKAEAQSAGVTVNSFATSLGKMALQCVGLGSGLMVMQKAFTMIKSGINTVVDLDTALIDLQKTSSASAEQLSQYYYEANESAKQLGVTTQEIIQSAADWSRLGYNLTDSKTMANVAAIFESISPGMTMEKSMDGLVSVMKAFDIQANDALDGIASKINIIGNTQAVNNLDLVEILTRSSAAMHEANNTLEETIALGTAATEITRDASSVGTALRTISMRIRGYDEETEEYIGGVEQLSGDIADLTKTASRPGGISLFTDASKTEYKSTIQLLRDISTIYDELTDKQQAALLEKLGGKRGGQVIAAILSNFDAVEKSLGTMENAAGNAEAEMSVIMQSLEYKINRLKETGTGIWQNLFQRDDIGYVVDGLTGFLNIIDEITDHIGLLGTAIIGISAAKGIASVVWPIIAGDIAEANTDKETHYGEVQVRECGAH